jgi:hypothetical protein
MFSEGQAWLTLHFKANDDNQPIEFYTYPMIKGDQPDKWYIGFQVINREQLTIIKLLDQLNRKLH